MIDSRSSSDWISGWLEFYMSISRNLSQHQSQLSKSFLGSLSGQTAQIHINGHRAWGPAHLEPAAGVMSRRRCWDRTRTRPTGVYTPLDQTTRTALPACTCLDPQPSARDLEEWRGPIKDGSGWRQRLQLSRAGTGWDQDLVV